MHLKALFSFCFRTLTTLLLVFSAFPHSRIAHAQAPPVLQGQVLDANSGLPVEGAQLVLDLIPVADPVEGRDTSSAFGLFRFEQGEVPTGSYELRVTHPAYLPESRPITIGVTGSESLAIELQPISGENFFDVYTQVAGVVTGIPLGPSQETVVTLTKFGAASGDGATGSWQATTDPLGSVIFRGLQDGFYEFSIITEGDWEPYTSSRQFFNAPQQANFYLKPNSGPLNVTVTGWNPAIMGMSTITNAFVELTGYSPNDPDEMVVPTRTGVTENGGSATFTDLPPVNWLLVTRRMGYAPLTNVVNAVQIGGVIEANLAIEDRHLQVTLTSEDYENLDVFRGLSVWLQGVKNSNTEGFERELMASPGEGENPSVRLFESILPGRYRLSVNGKGNADGLVVHPGFTAEDFIEIYETGVVEWELALQTKLAVIYGQLQAADKRASANSADQSEAEILGRPRYLRKAANEIALIEYEIDPILTPTIRTNIVQTDENGFFFAAVKPARYGLLIDELDEYWGSHVNLELITPDPSANAPAGEAPDSTPPTQPDPPVDPNIPGLPDIPNIPTPPTDPTGPINPNDPAGALALLNAIGLLTDLIQIPPNLLTPDLLDEDDDPQALLNAANLLGLDLSPELQSFLSGLAAMQDPTETPDGGGSPTIPNLPDLPTGPPSSRSQFFAVGQGWPFYQEWPFDGRPPSNGTPQPGEPLVIESEHYSLDVFVRRQVLSVINTFGNGWLSSPTQNLITGFSEERFAFITADFSELAEIDGIATLTSTTTGIREADIIPTAGNVTDFFAFHDVPSGDYTFNIENDRFEFLGNIPDGAFGDFLPPDFIGTPILPIAFSVPTWNPPGVLPPRDPADPDEFEPLSAMPPGGFSGLAAFGALTKDEAFHVTWRIKRWIPDPEVIGTELEDSQGEYQSDPDISTADGNLPTFIRTAYAGDLVFQNPSRLPVGPYEYWDDYFGRWQSVGRSLSIDVTYGGPANNIPEEVNSAFPDPESGSAGGIPVPRTQLKITSINEAEPDFEVPGVSIRVRAGSSVFNVNSGTTVAVTDDVVPIEVTGQGWLGLTEVDITGVHLRHNTITHDPSVPSRELIVYVKRGMNLRGTATIADAGMNGSAAPLPKGEILIRDRFGVIIFKTRTDAAGTWSLGETVEVLRDASMSLYVDVRSPGYKPWRKRYSPNNVVEDDGGFIIVVESELEPLPQPEITSLEFDKQDFGLYLPGVSRAGNQNNYTRINSPGPLTLRWTLAVDATPQQFDLVGFDDENGIQGAPETITVFNLPKTVTLIDPKGSLDNPADGDTQFDWIPENTNNIAELRSWLNDIRSGAAPNVFHDESITFDPLGGNQWEAVGITDIWRMPPGLFRPLIVLESENGGISMLDPYQSLEISPTNTDPSTPRLMTGLRLPPWLAFTAELFGSVAAADRLAGVLKPNEDAIVQAAPKGRFQMRPEFEATITEQEGKIDYDYRAAVKWSEGMATPDSGFLKLAANHLGLVFDTELRVGARGSENRVFIEGGTGVSNPEIEVNDYLPRALADRVEAEGSAEVQARITLEEFITPNDDFFPVQMRLSNQVSGAVQATLRYNMTPILSKIPTIGPVILSLDKTEALQILGRLQGGIGANFVNRWTTFYPNSRGGNSGVINHVYERHLLGGRAPGDAAVDNMLNLCFNFGVGMDINLAGGRLGASGTLSITGENCGLTSLPALQITPNLATVWPPIERVDGALEASIEAFLDVWVTRFEKRWAWDLIRFSHQFGTEPMEDIRAIGLASTVFSPVSALPSTLDPDSENLLSDLYPSASIASAQGSGTRGDGEPAAILVYSDVNPTTGAMRLMTTFRTEAGTFSSPTPVAEASGIVSLATTQTDSGAWLVAWTELDSSDMGNPFPPSQVRAATSEDAGASWSEPELVVSLPGVAADLQLESFANQTGLLYLHTNEGPASQYYEVGLASRRDGQWRSITDKATGTPVESIVIAGGNDKAAIVYRYGNNLEGMLWNGPELEILPRIANDAGDAFAMNHTENIFQLVWTNQDGDVNRSLFSGEQGAFAPSQVLLTGVFPSELAIASSNTGNRLGSTLAWVDSADIKSVWTAMLSSEGSIISPPEQLSPLGRGRHSRLQIFPQGDTGAKIVARFDDDGASLRQYERVFSTGQTLLRLEVVGITSEGQLELRLSGNATGPIGIEASADLNTWIPIPLIELTTLPSVIAIPTSITDEAETLFLRGVTQ